MGTFRQALCVYVKKDDLYLKDIENKRPDFAEKSEPFKDVIVGRNAVNEALKAKRPIDKLYIQTGIDAGMAAKLVAMAKSQGIAIKEVDRRKLDYLSGGGNHQGIAAVCAVKAYAQLEDIFLLAEARGEAPFLIVCDELEDPHNLGAILRTAECSGAHGVVIPKRRSAGLTYAVGKASAGAVEYIPVARVVNIADLLTQLKERGLWVYTADMDGQPWCETDFSGPLALVIGSEGKGVGKLVKQRSDFVVSLPIKGKINSLNASVAAGVICYEIARQRSGLKAINP